MRIVLGIVVAVLLAALGVWSWPYLQPFFTGGAQAAAALLAQFGPWGPFVVIGLQVLQAVISPLPSWPVTVASGALYGTWLGTFYALVGGTLGATVNFWLARRYGKPYVAKMISPSWMDKADRLQAWHVAVGTMVIRVVPFMSFDFVAYLAGISRLRYLAFLPAILIGQLPGLTIYAFVGSDLAAGQRAGNWVAAILLGVILMGTFAARWFRRQDP